MRPYNPAQARFRIRDTDAPMPERMVSGWMRYSDFEPLAKGGTCELRTALDRNLGRRVVIKTLLREIEDDKILQQRFLREARITAQIQHPNTPPVYEVGRDERLKLYFSMKQVAGRSFREILDGIRDGDATLRSAFPLFRQLEVFTQVAMAAGYAHACGVVHRDLKPANIQVGHFGEVILLDWGLAKVLADPDLLHQSDSGHVASGADSMTLTRQGSKLGTPLYMSPEQVRSGEVKEASDTFSMGVILYEILTLEHLFQGADIHEVREEILHKPIAPPSEVKTIYRVPAELDAICLKALKRDPAERYGSLIELVNDLVQREKLKAPLLLGSPRLWQTFAIGWQEFATLWQGLAISFSRFNAWRFSSTNPEPDSIERSRCDRRSSACRCWSR